MWGGAAFGQRLRIGGVNRCSEMVSIDITFSLRELCPLGRRPG